MNTIITEINDKGEEIAYDVFSKLIDSRILFLHDYISDEIATDIVATLIYLDHQNEEKISLYINSEGGSIESVFMLYDTISMLKSPVETLCMGSAIGEPALLLAAGTKGMRFATKSSVICINQLYHKYSVHSDMTKVEIMLEQSKKENNRFLEALSKCTGKSIKKLTKDTERDFFMSVNDAKKYGIIDEIIGDKK
jgi:ATP-dependent Clp protease protease subunit